MPEIRNPNLQTPGSGGSGSGGDMRSTMLFFSLMLLVLLGYQFFFKPKEAPPAPSAQSQSQSQPASQPSASGESGQPQLAAAPAPAAQPVPSIAAVSVTETTVENDKYKIVFTNRGAQVQHWILKGYYDSGAASGGHLLDLVQPQVAARFGLPLSFFTYEPALTEQLNQALYQPSATGSLKAPDSLTFRYAYNGLDVVKTFHFDNTYVVSVETEVKRNGSPVRALLAWPGGLGDMEEFLPSSSTRSPTRTPSYFAWSIGGKQDYESAGKVHGNATLDEPYEYAAITDLYFAAAFLPGNPARATVVTLHNSIDLPNDLNDPNSQKKPNDVLGLAVGDQSGSTRVRLFAGPKAMDALTSTRTTGADGGPTGPSLESLIQFGWITVIAKPLYLALRYLVEHGVPNWGWAIIVVTVVFYVLMLPTRVMTMKSSLKMMRIQPKTDAIRKRYSHLKMNDPKRAEMNTEMMELYKKEGVNMYGSCLPMLLQMPLFFGYYRVLANVIELRQARWFWLHDLSVPDPLFILPAIILVSMFLVQFLTPSPGMDPSQRKMMAIMMPIIFGFTMSHFASGLALYWCTGNLINLAIQLAINQSGMGKEMHAIAAKRANKKNEGGGPLRGSQGRR